MIGALGLNQFGGLVFDVLLDYSRAFQIITIHPRLEWTLKERRQVRRRIDEAPILCLFQLSRLTADVGAECSGYGSAATVSSAFLE